jgi:hypothetical protein
MTTRLLLSEPPGKAEVHFGEAPNLLSCNAGIGFSYKQLCINQTQSSFCIPNFLTYPLSPSTTPF